jgi:Reverse transcriptase (RNA-dependent DNA polymerase)
LAHNEGQHNGAVNSFYNESLDLKSINKANIVLVPKKALREVSDFRPISVINYVPKLISKVLANRLRLHMPHLISKYQTSFIKGRFIADNFLGTREVLHHIHATKEPAVLFKIDFSKTFDTVQWAYLLKLLIGVALLAAI